MGKGRTAQSTGTAVHPDSARTVRGVLVAAIITLALAGCTGSSSQNDDAVAAAKVPNGQCQTLVSTNNSSGSGAPSVSLTASALEINEGGSVSLCWTAANADSCTASGGWSGSLSTSGSKIVGPLSGGTTFSLSCTGPGGSVLEMLSVGVIGPVELSWVAPEENVDGSTLTDLAGYRIYYGTSSRSYSDSVDLADPNTTAYTLTLASGDYYVAMTALDAEGNESGYSNEIVKTRP